MSPDLLALARAYVALPGAPTPISRDMHHPGWRDGICRDDLGCFWRLIQTCDPDTGKWDAGWWAVDLTDDATGGILLCHLPPGWLVYQRAHDGRWEVGRPDGEHRQEGSTLAEACARAAVALGRAA